MEIENFNHIMQNKQLKDHLLDLINRQYIINESMALYDAEKKQIISEAKAMGFNCFEFNKMVKYIKQAEGGELLYKELCFLEAMQGLLNE